MDVYKIMQKVASKPPKDKCTLFTELLDKKLRSFDENMQEILMHELLFRTKMVAQQQVTRFQPSTSAFNVPSQNIPFSFIHPPSPISYSSDSSYHTQPSPTPSCSQYSTESSHIMQDTSLNCQPPENFEDNVNNLLQNNINI